jgi:hypothetical protein
MATGRPTKLCDEVAQRIVALVRAGNWLSTAAGAAGVHRDTVYDWLKRGEAEDPPDTDAAFVDFALAYRAAEADAEAEALAAIRKRTKNHKGQAWWLERRHPDRWGRRVVTEHTGPDGGPIKAEVAARVVVLPLEDDAGGR